METDTQNSHESTIENVVVLNQMPNGKVTKKDEVHTSDSDKRLNLRHLREPFLKKLEQSIHETDPANDQQCKKTDLPDVEQLSGPTFLAENGIRADTRPDLTADFCPASLVQHGTSQENAPKPLLVWSEGDWSSLPKKRKRKKKHQKVHYDSPTYSDDGW